MQDLSSCRAIHTKRRRASPVKCPRCGYEWKIQRKLNVIGRVRMRSVALKEARTESTSEAKEAEELHLEESQQRPTSAGQAAAPNEEETVALAWLLYWMDQGVVTWAI
jgi:hypothetical protein